jgi:exopolysaccharide biosynthesis polyprenyl glycosylphosphotransferase
MLVAAVFFGYFLRTYVPLLTLPLDPPTFLERYLPLTTLYTLSVLTFFYFARMYHQRRTPNRLDLLWQILQNVSIGTIFATSLETLALRNSSLQFDYPRAVLLFTWFFSILFVMAGREFHRQVRWRLQKLGLGRDRVLVVGDGEIARTMVKTLRGSAHLGYELVGAATYDGEGRLAKSPVLGKVDDLPRLIDSYAIDQVIIALPEASRSELARLVAYCQRGTVEIKLYPDNFAFVAGALTVEDLMGIPLLSVRDVSLRGWKLSLKRAVDFLGAAFGLIILSPLMLWLAYRVWRYDGFPVFFSQERVGLDGKPFQMIKFRTMVKDAENRAQWTVTGDPRVTPVGRFMRPRNLDELPQLINVLFGQMSLVGPRPEQVKFVEDFRQQYPRYHERHREKSGMTGWAQVNGLRGDTSIEERLRADLYYVENWSLWLDLKIIARTIWQTLTKRTPHTL